MVGVCALLVVAWLAGRGFMDGGAAQVTAADAARPADAPRPQTVAGASAPVASVAESQPSAAQPVTDASMPADAGLDADRFAALSAALTLHAARGEFAACAAAWRHLSGLPLSPAQRAACEAAVLLASQAVAERLGRAGALLAAGRAAAAVRVLAPLRGPSFAGCTALDLLHPTVAAAVAPMLNVQLQADAVVPAPRPMARGRLVVVWLAETEFRGVCVAADAESVTLQVRRDDGSSFPRARYADCDPDNVTGAEAVELGLAAMRDGDPALTRAWQLVAAARGGAGARFESLTKALR